MQQFKQSFGMLIYLCLAQNVFSQQPIDKLTQTPHLRRLVIAFDRSGSAMNLLFNDKYAPRWNRLFGRAGSKRKGQVERWLQQEMNKHTQGWSADRSDVYSYGFKYVVGNWKNDYLQKHYEGRGDPFEGLKRNVQSINHDFYKYGLSTAAVPMLLSAIAHPTKKRHYQELILVHLHDGQLNLETTDMESMEIAYFQRSQGRAHNISRFAYYRSASVAVNKYYKIEKLAEKTFINKGTKHYIGVIYRVAPVRPVGLDAFYTLVGAPQWQPTASGYKIEIELDANPKQDAYQLGPLELTLSGGPLSRSEHFKQEASKYRAAITILHRGDPSDLPKAATIRTTMSYIPQAMNLGLSREGKLQYPITVQKVDPIPIGLPLPGFDRTMTVHEAIDKHPQMTLSEIRVHYAEIRQARTTLMLTGTVVALLAFGIGLYYTRRRFPPAKLIMQLNMDKDHVADKDGVLTLPTLKLGENIRKQTYSLGELLLSDHSGPNKMGHYPAVEIENFAVRLLEKQPVELKSSPLLITAKGLSLGTSGRFYQSLSSHLYLNLKALKNIADIDFPENQITFKFNLELRLKRLGDTGANFTKALKLLLPIKPAPYVSRLDWEPGSSEQIEFAGSGTESGLLGTLTLRDETAFRYREAATVQLECQLAKLGAGKPAYLPRKIMRFLKDDVTLPSSLKIENQLLHQDIRLHLQLDFKQLEPVVENTKYRIHICALVNGRQENVQAQFTLVPNTKEARLHGSFMAHLGDASEFEWSKALAGIDLRTQAPIVQSRLNSIRLLTFRLWNTAEVNLPGDSNAVCIEEIGLMKGDLTATEQPLLRLRLQLGKRIEHQLREPFLLKGGATEKLEIQVNATPNLADEVFDERYQNWTLTIAHRKTGEEVATRDSIPIWIAVNPDHSSEVIAVDFGTSAIAIADATENDLGIKTSLIPLKKHWSSQQNGVPHPYEKDDHLLISTLKLTTEEDGEEHFVVGHSKIDLHHRLIPFLKSHIGGCREVYHLNGKEHAIGDLVRHAYADLNQHYIRPHRRGKPFKRMVITHPNNYLDGQVRFLKARIRDVLPSTMNVLAMSESDGVVYHYLEQRKRSNARPALEVGKMGENLLCFDIGAGTVDLSLRRIGYRTCEATGLIASPEQSELLGMVSINGAGNLLDELIAHEIDASLNELFECYRQLVKEGKAESGAFYFMSCVQAEHEASDRSAQQAALLILRENIKQAKQNASISYTRFVVTLPTQNDKTQREFLWVNEDVHAQICPDPEQLPYLELDQDGVTKLHLSFEDFQKRLVREYLPSQVCCPLDTVLENAAEGTESVDTLLISGRAALFPGIREAIIEHIYTKTGVRPNAPKIEPDRMKTNLVSGALRWGIHKLNHTQLFSTPKLHGTIGIALKYAGSWQWFPLVSNTSDEEPLSERVGATHSLSIMQCSQLLVLHTPIRNCKQVIKYLDLISIQELFQAKEILEAKGIFRVLHGFEQFSQLHYFGEASFWLTPIFPEDGPAIYGDFDPNAGYLNVRVRLEAHGGHGQILEIKNSEAVASEPLYFHDNWPDKIFALQNPELAHV